MNYCQFRNETIKRMANAGDGILPAEYQQVEYLQSTGNNWIDSGINATNTLQTDVTFSLENNFLYNNNPCLLGMFYSGYGSYFVYFPASTKVIVPTNNGNSNTTYTMQTDLSSGTHTVLARNGYLSIDDIYIGVLSGLYTRTLPIRIIGRYGTDSNGNYSSIQSNSPAGIRIYSAKLGTSDNDTQYRDLYPCYRKADNVTGMYDLITSTFIPYSGTENFIIGNNV